MQTPGALPSLNSNLPCLRRGLRAAGVAALLACAGAGLAAGADAVAPAARSAEATLQGRVFNQATGAALEGATVQIVGTERSVFTERDGGFALSRLAAGSAVLRVTYPGLDVAAKSIDLTPGLKTLPDPKLTSDIYAMEAFAVTAVREDNAAAIARQENALTITNSVSTDACGNVAKGDMGSFLQRLPGLVDEYGGAPVDAISVRGLSPEFTSLTMDGARLAAAIARTSRWITRMCSCSSAASSASRSPERIRKSVTACRRSARPSPATGTTPARRSDARSSMPIRNTT
jgi:hypothetical protein